jgi:hypothetical protein
MTSKYDGLVAEALQTYVPPTPEPSEQFPDLLDRPNRRIVKLRNYRPVATPSVKLSGSFAREMAENDAALDGYRLVSATEEEATFEFDSELAGRAQLRKDHELYVKQWSHAAALGQVGGAPLSPVQYMARMAAGEPLFEPPEAPVVIDPAEARLRAIEEKLARVPLSQMPR